VNHLFSHHRFNIYLCVVFLNAFIDFGHKVTLQNVLLKHMPDSELRIYSALLQVLILLPFILTMTPAGFLADKFPKNKVLRICVVMAIPIILGIALCYYTGEFWWAFVLTFMLALQSAFYSPAKLGYIRELLGKSSLGPANAAVQAATIIALLLSTLLFSLLFEYWYQPADMIAQQ